MTRVLGPSALSAWLAACCGVSGICDGTVHRAYNFTLLKYAGDGIPCLVVVDANGKVISDSYAGKTYRGPAQVLNDLDQLFATTPTGQLAQESRR